MALIQALKGFYWLLIKLSNIMDLWTWLYVVSTIGDDPDLVRSVPLYPS